MKSQKTFLALQSPSLAPSSFQANVCVTWVRWGPVMAEMTVCEECYQEGVFELKLLG